MSKKTKVIIFVICLAFVLAISVLALYLIPKSGTKVVITVNGEQYGTYPLDENTVLDIKTNSGHNIVEVKDGQVRVTEADCPNQICVKTHPMSKDVPYPIVCLPHKLTVELR